MSHPLTIRNSNGIFQAKTVDTCNRRNKATIISISTNVFLFPYHFRLLPFPFHCFFNFSETKLVQSGISITVFTPRCNLSANKMPMLLVLLNHIHQKFPQEQEPPLKWWNLLASRTTISLSNSLDTSLVNSWQSPHTLR
jgi:hypothetical protein